VRQRVICRVFWERGVIDMTDRQRDYCRNTAGRAKDRFERAIEQIERGEPGTASDMLKRVIDECKALRKQLAGMKGGEGD